MPPEPDPAPDEQPEAQSGAEPPAASNGSTARPGVDPARLAGVNLNLLVPLHALLEERSVTRAADRLGLSQPAVSHALARLREQLGDRLLVRDAGRMTLTPRAREIRGPLASALQQSSRILRPTSFDPATEERQVTMAMSSTVAYVLAPSLLRLLAAEAPGVVLHVRTENLDTGAAFTDEAVDLMLLSEGYATPHPRETLFEDRWIVLAHDDGGDTDALGLLRERPHVVFDDGAGRRLRPYEVLDERRVPYRVGARCSDYLLVAHLVEYLGGVALHRAQAAIDLVRDRPLVAHEFPFPVRTLDLSVVWNPWLGEDEFTAWLRDVLRRAAAPLRERYRRPREG